MDFFCRHHSKEHILNGIASGNMGVLVYNDMIVGTGCFDGNHITGVYVLPAYQNQGCGSYIMNCLEKEISKTYDTVILDASLSAACLYGRYILGKQANGIVFRLGGQPAAP